MWQMLAPLPRQNMIKKRFFGCESENMYKKLRTVNAMSDIDEAARAEVSEQILHDLQYELMLRSALAQLYEPLVQPDIGIEVISHLILHCCKIVSGSQNGLVATVNHDGVIVAHAQDLNQSIPFSIMEEEDKLIIHPDNDPGLLSYICKHHSPLLINSPTEHPSYHELSSDYIAISNLLSVPVTLGVELAGIIILANSNRDFTTQDIDGIGRIAKLFALAIQRRRWETALRESQVNLQALINNTSDLMWAIDKNYRVISANNSVKAFFKSVFAANLEVGHTIIDLLPLAYQAQWEDLYERVFKGDSVTEEQDYSSGSERIYFEIALHPIMSQGQITGVSCFARNITKRKIADEQLRLYAATDVMTGVLNRRTGMAVLDTQLQLSKRNNATLSVCFIDLNDLKGVNDRYGHHEGDAYIMLVAQTIRINIRDMDTVCRMGGDEFLIIFPQCSQTDAEVIYGRIDEQLQEYNRQEAKPYIISISHGTAEYNADQNLSAEELVSIADTRMYEEKRVYKENLAKQKQ